MQARRNLRRNQFVLKDQSFAMEATSGLEPE